MSVVKKLWQNKTILRIVTICSIFLFLLMVSFFTVNMILNSKNNHEKEGIPLYYEFKPNTVAYSKREDFSDVDISEEFLSYEVSYGIDVSEWQGKIDWETVAKTGIRFAMIRCGYRQIKGSEIHEDVRFKENIEGAIKAGLRVGVYFYGTAKNEKEALEEAEFTVNLIKNYNLTYPVVYDAEVFNRGRLEGVSYSTITDNILTFTETVGSYGYETMVYSFFDALTYMLDTGRLDGKLIWLSHFSENTGYSGNYNMWQYTETGRVDGIKTNVDLNISYFEYVDNEEDVVFNPRYKSVKDNNMNEINDKVKTLKEAELLSTPTKDMPNRVGKLKKGVELERTGVDNKFSRVTYNGKTVYIANDEIMVLSS